MQAFIWGELYFYWAGWDFSRSGPNWVFLKLEIMAFEHQKLGSLKDKL